MRGLRSTIVLLIVLVTLLFPARAEAYIDPSTGSLVLQVVVGALLSALYFIKLYWAKIRTAVRRVIKR